MNIAQSLAHTETAPEFDTEKIRALNDAFRRNIFNPAAFGDVILTAGVSALRDEERFILID
jgi:hypothetical protein